jgi:hypothetical protein
MTSHRYSKLSRRTALFNDRDDAPSVVAVDGLATVLLLVFVAVDISAVLSGFPDD